MPSVRRLLLLASLGVPIALSALGCCFEPDLVPKTWMAAGLNYADDLSADATHVYFADTPTFARDGRAIFRLSKEGGLPEAVALAEENVISLVIDETNAYWVDHASKSVRFAPKAGGAPPRALITEPISIEVGLAIDKEHVYFHRWKGPIVRVPKAGGEARVVVDPGGTVAAVDEGHVYFFTEQAIVKAPKGEHGAAITLAGGQRPGNVAIDATHVYWINEATPNDPHGGAVLRAPKAGGPATVLADKQTRPDCLAVSGDRVWFCNHYWNSTGSPMVTKEARIVSVPKAGGALSIETMDQDVRAILVDGKWLYHSSAAKAGGGIVQRKSL